MAGQSEHAPIGILTGMRFLVGDRAAILAVAAAPGALWLGLLFVLAAGLAREYDAEDLLHQPWYALLPIPASVLASGVLYGALVGVLRVCRAPVPFLAERYRRFLTLFWFSAPMAWLYAIPVERFLGPGDAMRANLLLLGLVSTWRVCLMIRILIVGGFPPVFALAAVLCFADVVALLALSLLPVPIIEVMGGIRYSEADRILSSTAHVIQTLGVPALPLLATTAIVAGWHARSRPPRAPAAVPFAVAISPGLIALGCSAVAVWALILPWTQPEQQLRRRVERDLRAGRIADGLATMSRQRPGDFPPHWSPPPRVVDEEKMTPPLLAVLQVIGETPTDPWVRNVYLEKLAEALRSPNLQQDPERRYLRALAHALERFPERERFLGDLDEQVKEARSQGVNWQYYVLRWNRDDLRRFLQARKEGQPWPTSP